jgi:hypothetical protein
MFTRPQNVGSLFHKGTSVILLGNAYAVGVANIRYGNNLKNSRQMLIKSSPIGDYDRAIV